MTRTDITNLIQSELPDNNTEAITPEDLRAVCIALNDNKFQLGEDISELVDEPESNLIQIIEGKLKVSIATESHEALQNLNGKLYLDPNSLPSGGGGSLAPILGNILRKDDEDRLYAKVSSASNTLLSVDNEGLVLGDIATPFHYVDSITADYTTIRSDIAVLVTFTITGRYLRRNCTIDFEGNYFTNVNITNRVETNNITILTVTALSVPQSEGTYNVIINVRNNGVKQDLLANSSIDSISIKWGFWVTDELVQWTDFQHNGLYGFNYADGQAFQNSGSVVVPSNLGLTLNSTKTMQSISGKASIKVGSIAYAMNSWGGMVFGLTNRSRIALQPAFRFEAPNPLIYGYRYFVIFTVSYAATPWYAYFYDATGYRGQTQVVANDVIELDVHSDGCRFKKNGILITSSGTSIESTLPPLNNMYFALNRGYRYDGISSWYANNSSFSDIKITGEWN